MSGDQLSRRDILRTIGGTLLSGSLLTASRSSLSADPRPAQVKLIDTHVHIVNSRLPGVLDVGVPLAPFGKEDSDGPKRLIKTIQEETKKAGVQQVL